MRVLGINGSLRDGSHNTAIVGHAGELFTAAGAQFTLYQGLLELPPFSVDDEVGSTPDSVARLRAAVLEADGAFIASPEYNSSIPSALKNALDWLSRPRGSHVLQAKPVVVIGTTTARAGAPFVQADLRRILAAAGARVVNRQVAIGRVHTRFDTAGGVTDPHLQRDIQAAVQALFTALQPPTARRLAV